MPDFPLEAMGPQPFRFVPSREPLQGTAFSTPFKLIASVIVLGGGIWLADLWAGGRLGASARQGGGWLALGLMLMAWTCWHILTSKTGLAAGELRQSWILNKRMPLADLAYAKLMRLRGFDWLIAPRLYVRTLNRKFAVFYAADPLLIREFQRLVAELAEFRRMK
jgi:hypothetical protein